ncbi:MAG: threonine-phosphate decarboxylase CobD [Candidatus Aquicultor sp.]|nr:threonine-phosphate decarboxylase CobD [Candidatus Aquicultor sp.]
MTGSDETDRLSEHGGNVRRLAERLGIDGGELVDFSSNINPYGPPESVIAAVRRAVEAISEYPEQQAESFVAAAADALRVDPANIVASNGSIELIYLIPQAWDVKRALLLVPSFTEYELALKKTGAGIVYEKALDAATALERLEDASREADMAIIGNPNNPCGYAIGRSDLLELIDDRPSCLWVIDEAFVDFVEAREQASLANDAVARENVVVLRSLTKMYGIAGLRLGYMIASSGLARKVRADKHPWSVNNIALEAGIAALGAGDFAASSAASLAAEARRLYLEISGIAGLKAYESSANYMLVEIEDRTWSMTSAKLQVEMLRRGIAIRDCGSYTGLDERYFRVAVKRPQDNDRLVAALRDALAVAKPLRAD